MIYDDKDDDDDAADDNYRMIKLMMSNMRRLWQE